MVSAARDILPKPTSANGSPLPFSPLPGPPPPVPKKRGRPSKADVELRQQEAIARGEVLPPSATTGTRTLTPKPPFKQATRDEPSRGLTVLAPMTGTGPSTDHSMGAHYQTEPSMVDSPGRKKRQRAPVKPKVSKISEILDNEATQAQAAMSHSGQSSFPSMNPQTTQSQVQEPQFSPRYSPPREPPQSGPPKETEQGAVPQAIHIAPAAQPVQPTQPAQTAQEESRPEVATATEPQTETKT